MPYLNTLIVALMLNAAAIERTPVAEWPVFTAPDRSFSVKLPGEPEVSGTSDARTFLVRIGDSTYYVKFMRLSAEIRALPAQTLLETARDGSVEALGESGGSTLESSESALFEGHPSLLFVTLATPKRFPETRVITRLVVLETGVLAITHSAPAKTFQDKRAKEFLESFHIPASTEP